MIVSPLATQTIISPNKALRTARIDGIAIHCMAGNATVKACGNLFAKKSKKASSNYGIDSSGQTACYAGEEYRSYCTSNRAVDNRCVTVEVANDGGAPQWHVSDRAMYALVRLLTDVCKRNGIKKLVWSGNAKDRVNWRNGCNMQVHRDYAKKACVPTFTEVLTKSGWVKISDIHIGDEVACADLDNLRITFEKVYDKVPVKSQDTYTCNEFTATVDHRMVYNYNDGDMWRIDRYNYLLDGKSNARIPIAGYYKGKGIFLSDDMIRFYVAVQADGHYMYDSDKDGNKKYYGLEFHLKKERKIARIKSILDSLHLKYTECNKSDGSVSIRVYNTNGVNIVNDLCEVYLSNKRFTWGLLEMSQQQALLFIEELKLWDGCVAANLYTSNDRVNLDIVNAIASINGVGSRIIDNNVSFRNSRVITIGGAVGRKRNTRSSNKRMTEVTCVSVKTGIFLARQDGKTFIIGNCPGDYLYSLHPWIASEVNKNLGVPAGSVTYMLNGVDYSRVFDANYYYNTYPDLQALGMGAMWDHFCMFGVNEARRGNNQFDPVVYRKMNADLEAAFGGNWSSYYWHYCAIGYTEHRISI